MPRLLDLFCGAGGAAMGYHRAGYQVTGVDLEPQPNYPFDFHRADALTFPLDGFDAIHASPPCQGYLNAGFRVTPSGHVRPDHPRLIGVVRDRLALAGVPFVIENIPGARAHLRTPIMLCGSSFGLAVRRHRYFELGGFAVLVPPCQHDRHRIAQYPTQYRPGPGRTPLARCVQVYGHGRGVDLWPDAMGIDWMTTGELAQAIPPAYTELIGCQLLESSATGRARNLSD